MDIAKLKVGDKVCYKPEYYSKDEWIKGIIKEIPEFTLEEVRVVYNCAGNWENYKDYTGVLTKLRDLTLGWKHEYYT